MTDEEQKNFIRDLVSNWIPAIILSLVGYLWFSAMETLKQTDKDIIASIEKLSDTQRALLIQVATLEERTRTE